MQHIVDLLNLRKKKEVEAHCKKMLLTSEEFSNLILAGITDALAPYLYWRHHVQLEPAHLWPTDEEHAALIKNGPGEIHGKALKLVKKIDQMYKQRKLLNVHLFYLPSKEVWHLFYFSQRDTEKYDNHWDIGPHIHYTHSSFVNVPLDDIVDKIMEEKPKLPKSVHIEYDYHHNRAKKNA